MFCFLFFFFSIKRINTIVNYHIFIASSSDVHLYVYMLYCLILRNSLLLVISNKYSLCNYFFVITQNFPVQVNLLIKSTEKIFMRKGTVEITE